MLCYISFYDSISSKGLSIPFDPCYWLRFAHNFIFVMILKITACFQAERFRRGATTMATRRQ